MFRTREEAEAHLAGAEYPVVLKADVLAAGKGVIICETEDDARAALKTFFDDRRFGATEVVLEEFLEGEELSLLALCDGERAIPLAPGAGLQADRRGRRGPEHRRHGQLLARARASTTATRRRSRAPCTSRWSTRCAAAGRPTTASSTPA